MSGDPLIMGQLWLGVRTRKRPVEEDEGTGSPIVLTINQDGVDLIDYTFSRYAENELYRGQAAIKMVGYYDQQAIQPHLLNESSIRIGIRGNDKWEPEAFFLWGERNWDQNSWAHPIAANSNPDTLSTQRSEGKLSTPLHLVHTGWDGMPIRRLWLLLGTADVSDAGTNSPVKLQISGANGLLVDYDLPESAQDDLERNRSNWYEMAPPTPFTRGDIRNIRLAIAGNDKWLPSWIFLFGVSNGPGEEVWGASVVPLVHVPGNSQWLSTDATEGKGYIDLELAKYTPSMIQLVPIFSRFR